MKKFKFLSVLLTLSIMLGVISPAASALSTDSIPSDVLVIDNIAYYGFQDDEKLCNFMVDTISMTGTMYLVYADNPDIMYEHSFKLPSTRARVSSDSFKEGLENISTADSQDWTEVYISDIVHIEEAVQDDALTTSSINNQVNRAVTDQSYFTSWLEGQFGASSYPGTFLRSSFTSGNALRQYEALLYNVSGGSTFTIGVTLTVTGFVTGVLGLILGPPGTKGAAAAAAISLIAGGATLLMGDTVKVFSLRANWFRYVTINDGSYPYSMADKFTYYDGYVHKNGKRAVASDYAETSYVTSYAYFIDAGAQFDDAYKEYLRIGWQG